MSLSPGLATGMSLVKTKPSMEMIKTTSGSKYRHHSKGFLFRYGGVQLEIWFYISILEYGNSCHAKFNLSLISF